MDATRCLKAEFAKIVFTLSKFGDFCTIVHQSHQSQFFLATYKNLQFSAKIDQFWLGMDATRCLKAEIAKIVFTLSKFGDFCTILHQSHQSQFFLATYKNLQFSAKIDQFWLGMDATRCLKAEIAKIVFTLSKFGDFCTILHQSHQSQFFLATYRNLQFSAKIDQFWLGMDATRCLKAEIAKIVFTLSKFDDFCTILHQSHQSQFFLATYKNLQFSAKIDQFWLGMDATRCLKAEIVKIVFTLSKFGDFCTILHQSHQSQFVLATYKNLQFSAKNDQFWLGMDATRCLKAENAKILFTLSKFGDFCTILHQSYQSQFFLATYKNLQFSAKIDQFWLGMDATRCLKAEIAKIVFTLSKFGDFCTILHQSHQSQFFLATYKNLQFSAKIDQFWLGMDATRCLKAEIAKIVFTLSKFGDFCTILHHSHQSQFFLATYKNLHISAKIDYFWIGMDATRCFKAEIAKIVFTLSKFGDFWTIVHQSHQSQFFLATYKNLQFSAKIDQFWLGMDATRCLKAEIAKIVFTLSKFGDFCTILHQSHQSQFFLATYKNFQFSAKIDQFWLGMDATRCLKAEIAKIVFTLSKFDDFCTILHQSHQSQFFLATYKNLQFSAKIDQFWLGMDATRCLKAEIAKIVFTLSKFDDFCTILHQSHQSQFFLATYKNLQFSAKIDQFWLGMDATRCLKAEIVKIVFTLSKFGDFCTILHQSPQSQFFLATYKNLQFSAKFDQFWLGMDATRWLKAEIAKIVFTLSKFGDFCTILLQSHQSQFFLATYKNLQFSAKNDQFWLGMDATRCLKAEIAKIVFTLSKFGDFCTILHQSHQSQFFLATYKNLQFSAKIGQFWLGMDATRCLKAEIAKIVFTLSKFGDFCTILHQSHQSQFFLATYKNLQFSAKIDQFWLGMDATRCLKAEIAKIVFTLSKFGDFCTILHQSHQSQFFLATYKNLQFSVKIGQFWLGRDATRFLKAEIVKIVFTLSKFGDFCTILHQSHQSQFFLATYKNLHFSAKIDQFWLGMDATRCLKAEIAKIVFTLSKFGDFCTILHQSHQSQFFMATYKNLQFSAKNDQFWLGMDATRCLKAEIAKIVFTLSKFGDFCTILHQSHQSQFFLATYKKLHISVKIHQFWLGMDATRCLEAEIARIVFTLSKFGDFCTILHQSHQSQFFLATYKNFQFSAKIDQFWLGMDATRCLKAEIAKIVFTLSKFGDFCTILHQSHQSQFFFGHLQKFAVFGEN